MNCITINEKNEIRYFFTYRHFCEYEEAIADEEYLFVDNTSFQLYIKSMELYVSK